MKTNDKTSRNVLFSTVAALCITTTSAVICATTDTKLKKNFTRTLNGNTGDAGSWSETIMGASIAAYAAVATMIQIVLPKGGFPANALIYPTTVSCSNISDKNATIILVLLLKVVQYSFKD